jgi:hypothetical protein
MPDKPTVSGEIRTPAKMARKPLAGGPRTPAGKAKSRRNARSHGIFCTALTMTAGEKSDFDKFQSQLRSELKPSGALLELLFDDVVTAAWQLKTAIRAGQTAANVAMREAATGPDSNICAEATAGFAEALNKSELGRRLKVLDWLKTRTKGVRVPADMEGPVTQAYGSEFWKTLTEWAPLDDQALMVGCVLAESHQYFGVDFLTFLPARNGKSI